MTDNEVRSSCSHSLRLYHKVLNHAAADIPANTTIDTPKSAAASEASAINAAGEQYHLAYKQQPLKWCPV